MKNPFRHFNSSPEVIHLTVVLYIRYPLSLRQVEDILFERGIDICHETVRLWWNRFGPMFAAEIRKRRIQHRRYSQWRWHVDEVFVRINGEMFYLWRAVDHEGEVLEVLLPARRTTEVAPTTGRRHGAVPGHQNPAEVRFRPRLDPRTTSTPTVTTTAAPSSSKTAQPRWPRGANWRHKLVIRRQFGDQFAFV